MLEGTTQLNFSIEIVFNISIEKEMGFSSVLNLTGLECRGGQFLSTLKHNPEL